LPGVNPWHCSWLGLKNDWCDADIICKSLHNVRKACNHADTICQGLSQGLCQERICQELKPWQGHLRWADLLVILLLAKLLENVQLPRLLAFCQGFCPWQNATFLVVSRKFSMCIIFSTGYIKIYNIKSSNEYFIQQHAFVQSTIQYYTSKVYKIHP